MKLSKLLERMIREKNSPELVTRITSVQYIVICTKAPSPTVAPFDSLLVGGTNQKKL